MNSEKIGTNDDFEKSRKILVIQFVIANKYAFLVTFGFFLAMSYAISQTPYLIDVDGVGLLYLGQTILSGDGRNAGLTGVPPAGPVLFASLDSLFHAGIFTIKIIQLLSGTGVVFVSYFVIRNVFNSKIALLGQLFIALNSQFELSSIHSLQEVLPFFLTSIALYFITKKFLRLQDIIITGSLLGVSFMIRYQYVVVLVAILIFLLVRDRKLRTSFLQVGLVILFFLTLASPVIIYNYSIYDKPINSNPNYYLAWLWKYQTPELHEKLQSLAAREGPTGIFLDPNLFLKNYFYNLFYNNPSRLFNFDTFYNMSIFLPVPFLGFIPFLGGLIYCLNFRLDKINFAILFGTALITAFFVVLLGDIHIHFFAIIIIPLLVFGIANIKKFQKNFLPLVIIPVIYLPAISVIPVYRVEQLFPMWLVIPTLCAVFFVEVIPKMQFKFKSTTLRYNIKSHGVNMLSLVLISLVLLINVGVCYKFLEAVYFDDPYSGLKSELLKIFQKKEPPQSVIELKVIGEMLSKQPGIENSYVMSGTNIYSYYAHSKFLFTNFMEGAKNDTLSTFITRKNWSPHDLYISNVVSYPPDRNNLYRPAPDYLIYQKTYSEPWTTHIIMYNKTRAEQLAVLFNPDNPQIPSNFELIYKSNYTVVYKINHNNDGISSRS